MCRASSEPDVDTLLFAGLHRSDYPLTDLRSPRHHYWGRKTTSPGLSKAFAKINRLSLPFYSLLQKVDVYCPTFYADALPLSAKPKVAMVLDMIQELFPDNFSAQDKTSRRKRELCERAELIVAISESTKRDLIRLFGVPAEKIRVVPLANSIQRGTSRESPEDRPYLLYVGARAGYKNFAKLLEVFSEIAPLHPELDLIAFGGPQWSAEEEASTRRLQLQGRVYWRAGSDELLARYYEHARAFVYPSIYEGFGIPPLEAMALDCPVITANASSIPEVVGEAALLVDPHSGRALREAIEAVLARPELRSILIEKGRRRLTQFSWDRTASQYFEVCREAFRRSRGTK